MFGRHKMTHTGTAKVLNVDNNVGGMEHVTNHGDRIVNYELIVEVTPDGGAAFRTKVKHKFAIFSSPDVGDEIKVKCNPETQDVELEVDDDARYNPDIKRKNQKAELKAREAALLSAAPGTPSGPTDAELAAHDPEMAELLKLEALEHGEGEPTG